MWIDEEVKELVNKVNDFLKLGNKLHNSGIDEEGSALRSMRHWACHGAERKFFPSRVGLSLRRSP